MGRRAQAVKVADRWRKLKGLLQAGGTAALPTYTALAQHSGVGARPCAAAAVRGQTNSCGIACTVVPVCVR